MEEKLKAKEIFERYYAMGDNRSLDKLCNALHQDGTSGAPKLRTLKKWSKEFAWQERVQQRDIENAKRLEKKTNTAVVNEKANYRKTIKEAFDIFKQNLKKGKVKIETIQDMERLAKLDLLIMGEATERGESLQEHKISDETIKKAYDVLYSDKK
jgi:hypothetical protein